MRSAFWQFANLGIFFHYESLDGRCTFIAYNVGLLEELNPIFEPFGVLFPQQPQ